MIDARTWARPSPKEVGDVVHRMRRGRSLEATCVDIGAKLGRSKRSVYYWMSENAPPHRQIQMLEWIGLMVMATGIYSSQDTTWYVFGPEEQKGDKA